MTSQKTIERCREKVKSLEEANKTLLDNNVILAADNQTLRKELVAKMNEVRLQKERAAQVESQRAACVRKCEIAISEKNRILMEKEQYIKNLHDTVWHLRNSFKCNTYNFSETADGFKFSFEFGRKQS